MDKQREMFEAWYSKHCEPGVGPWFVRDKDDPDEYYMSHTQTAWDTWQAAIASGSSLTKQAHQKGMDLQEILTVSAAEYGGDLNQALYDLLLGRKARESGMAEAVLAGKPAVPDGYKIVPVEPTPYMLAIGQVEWLDSAGADPSGDIYRAMIDAAP